MVQLIIHKKDSHYLHIHLSYINYNTNYLCNISEYRKKWPMQYHICFEIDS